MSAFFSSNGYYWVYYERQRIGLQLNTHLISRVAIEFVIKDDKLSVQLRRRPWYNALMGWLGR